MFVATALITATLLTSSASSDEKPTHEIRAQDIKVVAHIRSYDPRVLYNELRSLQPNPWAGEPWRWPAIMAAVTGMSLSTNPEPPARFSDEKSWRDYVAGKDYRGALHLGSFTAQCRAGQVVPRAGHADDGSYASYTSVSSDHDLGYTRYLVAGPVRLFGDGEAIPESNFRQGTTGGLTRGGQCLAVTERRAVRMSTLAQDSTFPLYGIDAPYIWIVATNEICCDGTRTVTVNRSTFPTHRLYLDGELVDEREQADWGRFIVSGGEKGRRYDAAHAQRVPAGQGMQVVSRVVVQDEMVVAAR
ncbi:MAG: hypothetical protein AB2A00_05590 [Myxococcota bacterium]